MTSTTVEMGHSHATAVLKDGRAVRYCLRCGALPGSNKHKSGCKKHQIVDDTETGVGPALCVRSNVDTLKFCADVWWWFHEADSVAGLKSSMGGQIDALELGVEIHEARDESPMVMSAGRKLRRMFAMMKLLSEQDYGVLRQWYTQRRTKVSEPSVARAHKAFYAVRGRK